MLHVTCYMQSVMCYMRLVTYNVKALLSMGKQGTKSFASDFYIGVNKILIQSFKKISGSQLLSDFQPFFSFYLTKPVLLSAPLPQRTFWVFPRGALSLSRLLY